MRSGTSFYNRGFGRSLLRRFWPLWVLWLLVLLYAPLQLAGIRNADYYQNADFLNNIHRSILYSGVQLTFVSIFAGALMAMAMLSYLYSPRSCGLVNSLPMRREEAYCTAFLTGLVPMLAAEGLTALVMLSLCLGIPGVQTGYLGQWLGMVLLGTTGFYGFACFCGMLTGNVLVLPAVYFALGFAAWIYESALRALLGQLVYGYTYSAMLLDRLAPIPRVLSRLEVTTDHTVSGNVPAALPAVYHVQDQGYLIAVGAAGLALGLLAVLILKKRHMESAGEIVAVPVLRPIFRVCMAVGGGLVLACGMCDWFLRSLLSGPALAAAAMVLLCAGAAIGWFVAEMLIKKTLRVFDHGWKQIGLIAACLVAVALAAELNLTGYETYVPDADQVESVTLFAREQKLTDPESIAAYCDFHRGLIAHKAENEREDSTRYWSMPLTYTLKDGRRVTRLYRLINNERTQNDPDSDLNRYEAVCNLPEAILHRAGIDRAVTADTVRQAYVNISSWHEETGWNGQTLMLTPAQAESLYREGILPDAMAGNIARSYAWESPRCRAEQSNMSLTVELTPLQGDPEGDYYFRNVVDVTVLMCSENTLRWLKENLALEPENLYELQQSADTVTPYRVYG